MLLSAYAGTILWETRWASRNYPPVKVGQTASEVRYLFGTPRAIEANGTLYRYSEPGREVAVRFSQAGEIVSVSCAGGTPAPATCPRILGIGIGSHEYDVLRRFGMPSRERFSGEEKTMYYDNVNTAFQLRLLKVTELELHAGASPIGFVPRALYAMIP